MRSHFPIHTGIAGIGLVLLWAVAASAQDNAALNKQLDKQITVQFIDTPLVKALEYVQRESGLSMVIDRHRMADSLSMPVALEAKSMTVRNVLDWICGAVDVGWDIRNGAVLVSNRREILRPYLVTRVYNVKALIQPLVQFVSPGADLNSSLSNTSSGGSDGAGIGSGEGVSIFGEADDQTKHRADLSGIHPEMLAEIVMENCGRPDDWPSNGGDLGVSVAINGGLLVVVHTEEVQQQVSKLLEQYAQAYGKMVSLDARYLLVPTDQLEAAIDGNDGILVMDRKQLDKFIASVGVANPNTQSIGVVRTVAFSGQRVYLTAGNEQVFLSDLEPISGAPAADITLSTMMNNADLDILPTIQFDDRTITLVLRSDVVVGHGMRATPVPVTGTITSGDEVDLSTSASSSSTTGYIRRPTQSSPASADVDLPSQDIVHYRTMARVPTGGGIVLSGFSSQFQHLKTEGREVVLVLRATVVK